MKSTSNFDVTEENCGNSSSSAVEMSLLFNENSMKEAVCGRKHDGCAGKQCLANQNGYLALISLLLG